MEGGLAKMADQQRGARTKNGFAPRICERCGRPFEWRKKWVKDWENVRYCSERCRRTPHVTQ